MSKLGGVLYVQGMCQKTFEAIETKTMCKEDQDEDMCKRSEDEGMCKNQKTNKCAAKNEEEQ